MASDALSQSAFDSSCYYPEIGNPNELDTIYGSKANQRLGDDIALLPPLKGEPYERLVMTGYPTNIPFLTAIKTGPTFDLHAMQVSKKYPFIFEQWPYFKVGHFRSPQYTDIMAYGIGNGFHPRIYWADENFEYDSARYTMLYPYNDDDTTYAYSCNEVGPYVAKLTSDTVDDIIVSVKFIKDGEQDSTYITLVKGGEQLFNQGKTAVWDEIEYWGYSKGAPLEQIRRLTSQADWRGVGRQDLITVDDWCNFFYYRNDPPFDLKRFVRSLREDTLMKATDWSLYTTHYNFSKGNFINMLSMKAFPKQSWDKSVDLIAPVPLSQSADEGDNNGLCIFKGGPDFGSKRLYFDSSDFFLRHPGYYGTARGSEWPGTIVDCGDLTGTGNHVLGAGGGQFTFGYTALYVLGKALDDKIDVFWTLNGGGYGGVVTIPTTEKNRPTYIWGAPGFETPEDQNSGKHLVGTIQMLNGAEKIPVRLNPKYSVEERYKLDTSIHHIIAYPNPCDQKTVLTFDNCTGDKMLVDVINAKGEVCQSEVTPSGFGLQGYALFLNSQPEGTYYIRLTCPRDGWSATTNVVKTGAYQTPWKLDLRKVMGR